MKYILIGAGSRGMTYGAWAAEHGIEIAAVAEKRPDRLADAGEKAMKEEGILPHHVEGHRGGTWILQDYGDVVVHLFDKEARAFYDLDRLWEDATVVDLSQVLQPGE